MLGEISMCLCLDWLSGAQAYQSPFQEEERRLVCFAPAHPFQVIPRLLLGGFQANTKEILLDTSSSGISPFSSLLLPSSSSAWHVVNPLKLPTHHILISSSGCQFPLPLCMPFYPQVNSELCSFEIAFVSLRPSDTTTYLCVAFFSSLDFIWELITNNALAALTFWLYHSFGICLISPY